MGLLPDTQNCGLCMRRERFPRHRGLAVSFEVGDGGNVPGTPVWKYTFRV